VTVMDIAMDINNNIAIINRDCGSSSFTQVDMIQHKKFALVPTAAPMQQPHWIN